MELFTLGADRGAYTEDDVRELARALTGWRNDWSAELGEHNFRFDPDRHDPTAKTVFGQTGNFDWRAACGLCLHNRLHASFFVEKLWSYFIPVPPSAADREALARPTSRAATQVRPVVEAILCHPQLLRRAPDGQAAGGLPAGYAAQARRAAWTPARGGWLSERRGPGALSPAERGRLGRRALAGHEHPAGALDDGHRAPAGTRDQRRGIQRTTTPPRRRRRPWPARSPSGATRRSPQDGLHRAHGLRLHLPPRRDGHLGAAPVPGGAPERPAPARGRLPRPSDELTDGREGPDARGEQMSEVQACGCAGLSRARLLRRAASAAVPGRGLPAIEAGMPTPAGTGLTRRSFMSRTAGLAMAVYGAGALGWDTFDEGIAAAAAAPQEPVLVSVFMEGGVDSLSVLAPVGDPRYASLRPNLKLDPAARHARSPRIPRLRWHPSAAGLSTLHGEGKVSVFPAIGYTDANQSHFTSRHFWEVGRDQSRRAAGLDGPLPRPARHRRQPAAGPVARLGPLALPGGRPGCRWPRSRRPTSTTSGPAASGAPVEGPMLDAIGDLGAGGLTRRPGLAPGPRRHHGDWAGCARRWSPSRPATPRPQGVTYPTGSDFAERLAALAAMLAAGLPLRCVAIEAAGGYDTHSDQASEPAGNLHDHLRQPARLPARPRGPRPGRPGAGERVERVRPPARRRTARAPTTARPGAALRDRLPGARHDGG